MIKTKQTHPDHPVLGQFYDTEDGTIYFAESFDSETQQFIMSENKNPQNKKRIKWWQIDREYSFIQHNRDGSGFSRIRPNIISSEMPKRLFFI